MAHQYTTDAIVIGTRESGEANKTLLLFTRAFGLVYGSARSVRARRAKLAPTLQTTSLGVVSLVRGKKGWKIVGGVERVNAYYYLRSYPPRKELMIQILKLVRRLVRGEEKNEILFSVLEKFLLYLTFPEFRDETLPELERLVALRILAALGYTTAHPDLKDCVSESVITNEFLHFLSERRTLATREINKALKEAQL